MKDRILIAFGACLMGCGLAILLTACGGNVIGQPGEPGRPGETGASGLDETRLYRVTNDVKIYSSGAVGASCKARDVALTGGCTLLGVGPDSWITQDAPNYQAPYDGWSCAAWHTARPSTVDTSPPTLTVSVTCYQVTP